MYAQQEARGRESQTEAEGACHRLAAVDVFCLRFFELENAFDYSSFQSISCYALFLLLLLLLPFRVLANLCLRVLKPLLCCTL